MNSLDELTKKIESHTNTKKTKRTEKKAFTVSLELFAGVSVGSFIGYHFDKYLNCSPIFLIICLFLGAAGSFLNIYRSIEKQER